MSWFSSLNYTDTTDVQMVRAVQLEDDHTLLLQCLFVNGSDAIGCLVVLQFKGDANSTSENLKWKGMDMCTMEVVNLTESTACIRGIFGYDIESNGSVGTLAVTGELFSNVSSLTVCESHEKDQHSGELKINYHHSGVLPINIKFCTNCIISSVDRWVGYITTQFHRQHSAFQHYTEK